MAKTLTQPLQHRFGLSPEWASEHIAKVNPDELETWRLQVLEAPTLEEVFVH
ncbi:MAG: hypothetical protein HQL64_16520 [Magnetococcales bacterium]|nr:hypothetical protein [Magnetococcales bacterium]